MNDTKKSSGVKCSNSEFIHGIFRDLAPGVMNGGCTIPGDPDNAKGWLARQGCAGFAECNNNYTSLSAFYAKPGERFSAKSSQCSAVYALLLDDIGTKVHHSLFGNFKLSWLLETSPDNYQGGIIFAEPVSPDCARALNESLIRNKFCDPGATSPATRWARLPVGVNGKAKYRDEAGNLFRCRLAEWRPECRYTSKDLISADDGLYYKDRYICAPVKIIGQTRSSDGKNAGLLVAVNDNVEVTVPYRLLHTEPRTVIGELADHGLQIDPADQIHLVSYLAKASVEQRVLVVTQVGWKNIGDNYVYVLPDRVIGNTDGQLVKLSARGVSTFRSSGALSDWTMGMGRLVQGHELAMFAVSVAFSPVLLELLRADGGVFNLHGASSTGKSSITQAAASVWGDGDSRAGFIQTWNNTLNAVEALAARGNDCLIVLDELGTAPPKRLGELAYMIAGGQGRGRMAKTLSLRETQSWRTVALSSGEKSFESILASGELQAGMLVRFCDIMADRGLGSGVFNSGGAETSDAIKLEACTHYGTAGPAFVERVIEVGVDKISKRVTESVSCFVKQVADGKSSQAKRIAGLFGLVAAAGELATEYKITGWEINEAWRAAEYAYQACMSSRETSGERAIEEEKIIEFVRGALFANQNRFMNYEEKVHGEVWGYVRGSGEEKQYLIPVELFKKNFCDGRSPRVVAQVLNEHGYLETREEGGEVRYAVQVRTDGKRGRFYILKSEIIATYFDTSAEPMIEITQQQDDMPF